ncbi:MAG: M3 family metallopeptidase [Rikenellaceae bacterium]
MKKLALTMALVASLSANAGNPNPLLDGKWNTLYETAPFSEIKIEHYVPAITQQVADTKQAIGAIVMQRSVPTFENTVVALEKSNRELSRTLGVLYNLNAANTSPELQQVVVEVTPILTEMSNDIYLNEMLFDRVKQVWQRREELKLSTVDSMLLSDTYKAFVRSGVNLSEEDKETYRKISLELAELSVKFEQNELGGLNNYFRHFTRKSDLKGLPKTAIEMAKEDAQSRGLKGYVITLQAPSYYPFMKYCQNRELREELYRASGSLCGDGGEFDNQENVKRITALRLQLAQLLGFETFADYALENRMASDAKTVADFLQNLLDRTIKYAKEDVELITAYAQKNGLEGELMPWDFSYYNEKYVTETFKVNDKMTRPYFQLEDAEAALFLLADKLYGLKFIKNSEIEVYHPDVIAYEVRDENDEFLAVLYCDYFPRASKNSGAWMNSFREAYIDENGQQVRPIVVLVNNFTKPTGSEPSLLSFGEFETMLHEFGHGLHGMLGKGPYGSMTGTSVYRDFVELPSQLMENWAYEKEYLDLFAKHYKTGEKMPEELIAKLEAVKNHLAAYANVGQVRYGMMDMAWHTIIEAVEVSVEQFEKDATKEAQLLPAIDGIFMSPAFGHIFSGGYAAGYYSYKWAEVLDSHAFSKFKEAGIFNKEVADSFRRNVLEKGGSEHPMTLYVRFAGEEPTVDALIKSMGIKE